MGNKADNDNGDTQVINGYQICSTWTDGVERVRDEELATRLGYARPRVIRDLIRRLQAEGKLNDIHQCRTVRHRGDGLPSKHATEYWLTEVQALKVIARSETALADAILDEVIAVFVAWRKGQLGGDVRMMQTMQQELAALRAQVTALNDVQALTDELTTLRGQVTALHDGTIPGQRWRQLQDHVTRVAQLELTIGRWQTMSAARRDLYREMGLAVGWGGKGQPWRLLPAMLAHGAFTVLRTHEATARRALGILNGDRQVRLPHVPVNPPPKPHKSQAN